MRFERTGETSGREVEAALVDRAQGSEYVVAVNEFEEWPVRHEPIIAARPDAKEPTSERPPE